MRYFVRLILFFLSRRVSMTLLYVWDLLTDCPCFKGVESSSLELGGKDGLPVNHLLYFVSITSLQKSGDY